jgi:hypothetical protein
MVEALLWAVVDEVVGQAASLWPSPTGAACTVDVMSDHPTTWELYERAADEVRWQVQLAEMRASRLSTFTALVLAAGIGLRATKWSALVFLLGSFSSLVGMRAVMTDHHYYRQVRQRMVELADKVDAELGFPATPRATPGQGSAVPRRWWARVQTAQHSLFVAMAVVGVVGAYGVLK